MQVSVVVPTRGRSSHAVECVEAVLANDRFLELIVVDQSDDRDTHDALRHVTDARLHYVRTDTRGVTRARNLGIELSRGDVIAFTDDDCRPATDWVRRIITAFESDPAAGVVCGRVEVPPDLSKGGWAESFHPRDREWQGRYPPIGQWGITANLSIRCVVIEQVGGFDPMLGAGAPLPSGGEPDLLFRVLNCGFKVVNADEVVVQHLGIRQLGRESTTLIRGYGIGTGAALLKHVRLGHPAAAFVYVRFLLTTVRRVGTNVICRRRPTGAGFLLALLSGMLASFRYRIDRRRGVYLERSRNV